MNPGRFMKKRQSTLSSFKESFNESENFMNVEEKDGMSNLFCPQNIPQKSLKQLIRERFIGPIMAEHGNNSESLLKRNVLMTNSNISSGVESNFSSIADSFKSSFIIKKAKHSLSGNKRRVSK